MELPNHMQPHDGQVQTNSLNATGDTTERLHAVITEGQLTAPRTSEKHLDDVKDLKSRVETQSRVAGKEESKDELQPPSTGEKRRRSRRTQLADLLAGVEPPAHGKRSRSVVDYTPSLDKEDTKAAAKDIRTLPGLRNQRWPVGYARSTINKVLAPGQDAGYGLFATSPIE